jgi:hypothetical protein
MAIFCTIMNTEVMSVKWTLEGRSGMAMWSDVGGT